MPRLADYQATIIKLGLLIRIAEDAEAFTYAKSGDATSVVRLFKDASLIKFEELKRRKAISNILATRELPFNVEIITAIHIKDGLLYTEQSRIVGVTIGGQNKKTVAIDTRQFFEAIKQISELDSLPGVPTVTSWAEFIAQQTRSQLLKHTELLRQRSVTINPSDVVTILRAITDRLSVIPRLGLVHGKITPNNYLINPQATDKTGSMIGFGATSIIGDVRFDIAAALFFLEALDSTMRKTALRVYGNLLRANYDPKFYEVVNIYRLYLAMVYLTDETYQAAALYTMKNWLQIINADYYWQPLTVELPALALFKQNETITDETVPILGVYGRPTTVSGAPNSPLSGGSPSTAKSNDSNIARLTSTSTSSILTAYDFSTIEEGGVGEDGEDGEIDHGNQDDKPSGLKQRLVT